MVLRGTVRRGDDICAVPGELFVDTVEASRHNRVMQSWSVACALNQLLDVERMLEPYCVLP